LLSRTIAFIRPSASISGGIASRRTPEQRAAAWWTAPPRPRIGDLNRGTSRIIIPHYYAQVRRTHYCYKKRQLSTKELRRVGLVNDDV
jgi:hypothetical protein